MPLMQLFAIWYIRAGRFKPNAGMGLKQAEI